MRLPNVAAVLALVLGTAEACSLVIPFEDYPGPALEPSVSGHDASTDSPLTDVGVVDVEGGEASSCLGVDLQSDPLHCGACGRRCANDGGCEGGFCPLETVLDAGRPILALSIARSPDAGANSVLYFTDDAGVVGRRFVVEDAGGALVDAGASGAVVVAPTGTSFGVFAKGASVGAFRPSTFDTNPPTTLAKSSGAVGPIALYGNYAFWGDNRGLWWKDTRVVELDAGIGGLFDASPPPTAFAIASDALFWAATDGRVREMQALFPGVPKVIHPGSIGTLTAIGARRTSQTNLYLCQPGQGLLFFEQTPTGMTPLAPLPMEDCETIVVTSTNVYAVNVGRADLDIRKYGEIWRTSLDGSERILLARGLTDARALGVDGDFVYFATGTTIARTTR